MKAAVMTENWVMATEVEEVKIYALKQNLEMKTVIMFVG